MNEAAKNISELISGNYSKTIVVAGRVYVMKAPAIKVITRATQYLGKVDLSENATVPELIKILSEQSENVIKGLSYLIVGDVGDYELQLKRITGELRSGTHEELLQAFMIAFELIVGRDFFGVCQLAMELARMTVRQK